MTTRAEWACCQERRCVRYRRYAARAQSRAAWGWAAAKAQLAAISRRSAFSVRWPWISSISPNAASASARASPASPAASSTAHRLTRSVIVGTFNRW